MFHLFRQQLLLSGMVLRKRFEIILLIIFFAFSIWLMWKSFSYDSKTHEFVVSRNEVGDFGLHLALVRSFSWGNNFPTQSPFYPGPPLPYHYGFDLFAGLLERAGIRIDYAVNGISVIFFVLLLYLIYKLPRVLFRLSPLAGILAVMLFLFSSNLSFVEFFKGKTLDASLLQQFLQLPDYINKGPYDGSMISIFSSLNPYLNQRHLIVGMALSILIISYAVERLVHEAEIFSSSVVTLGILLGLGTRIHILVSLGTGVVVACLLLFFRRARLLIPFIVFFVLFALPHINELVTLGRQRANFFYPGFLASRPLTIWSFVQFWWLNIGLAVIFIPLGFIRSDSKQKKLFLSTLPLFIIANLFQLSFRIEHNYSLIAVFLVICIAYEVRGLMFLWEKEVIWKIVALASFVGLTLSGFLNLMVVKNDFHYRVTDGGSNPFMQWIKNETSPNSIFLSPQNLYDPVALSGRRSYFGATYYLEVMGYEVNARKNLAKVFFESTTQGDLNSMKAWGIGYVVIPRRPINDFPYTVHRDFFQEKLLRVYSDSDREVYKL